MFKKLMAVATVVMMVVSTLGWRTWPTEVSISTEKFDLIVYKNTTGINVGIQTAGGFQWSIWNSNFQFEEN